MEAKGCFVTFGLHELDKQQYDGMVGQGIYTTADLRKIKDEMLT